MPTFPLFRALSHRNFRLFFFGQGLSLIGTWLQQVAMSWLTYRLSGSALLLGVVTFCQYIAVLLVFRNALPGLRAAARLGLGKRLEPGS